MVRSTAAVHSESRSKARQCPDCVQKMGTASTIGNRRASCGTCNRFAQRVLRRVRVELERMHPGDAGVLRELVEAEVYADLEVEWTSGAEVK